MSQINPSLLSFPTLSPPTSSDFADTKTAHVSGGNIGTNDANADTASPAAPMNFVQQKDSLLMWRNGSPNDEFVAEYKFVWKPDGEYVVSARLNCGLQAAGSSYARVARRSSAVSGEPSPAIKRAVRDKAAHSPIWTADIVIFKPEREAETKGILVFMSGLFGPVKAERQLMQRFRDRGWWVANIQPAYSYSNEEQAEGKGATDSSQSPQLTLENHERLGLVAGGMAAYADLSIATSLVASRAVMKHLMAKQNFTGLRRAMVAVSYGALVAPAVIAGGETGYDSLVLIAGGADLGQAGRSLGFVDSFSKFLGGKNIGRSDYKLFSKAYLASSGLDPIHWAPNLRGIRTLQIDGYFDRVVPRGSANLLHRQLGCPERWTFPVGHIPLLLFALNSQVQDSIVNWVEQSGCHSSKMRDPSNGVRLLK